MDKIVVKNVNLMIDKKILLDDINLEVKNGEAIGFVGRNGSGKTLLMKCICGFIKPSAGEIIVDGEKIGVDMDFPKSIGVIIETPGFIPYYSGFKNLKYLSALSKKLSDEEIRACLKLVGLEDSMKKAVKKYSLGMKQRLGIAQAIMQNPDLIILDEPFNGLDEEGVQSMRKVLLDLKNKGKTIIMASHYQADIDLLCDMVIRLEKGKIVDKICMDKK